MIQCINNIFKLTVPLSGAHEEPLHGSKMTVMDTLEFIDINGPAKYRLIRPNRFQRPILAPAPRLFSSLNVCLSCVMNVKMSIYTKWLSPVHYLSMCWKVRIGMVTFANGIHISADKINIGRPYRNVSILNNQIKLLKWCSPR